MRHNINKTLVLGALLSALPVFRLSLKADGFSPRTLTVPAGVKFELIVSNEGSAPAEFESFKLHREQLVLGGGSTTVYLGPLAAGTYDFFDDFHGRIKGLLVAAKADGK